MHLLGKKIPLTLLKLLWSRLKQGGSLMVGVGDYQTYVKHMQHRHPNLTPMTQAAFVNHCMQARYGGEKQGKCPC